jgi:hypothetical protein
MPVRVTAEGGRIFGVARLAGMVPASGSQDHNARWAGRIFTSSDPSGALDGSRVFPTVVSFEASEPSADDYACASVFPSEDGYSLRRRRDESLRGSD